MGKRKTDVSSLSINGGNVIGVINASGRARVTVSQKVIHQATPQLEKLFKSVYKSIETRPKDSKFNKKELESHVKMIEQEASKGQKADKDKLEKWISFLAKMAPDIVDVMMASLGGPVAGFTAVFKKIVARASSSGSG